MFPLNKIIESLETQNEITKQFINDSKFGFDLPLKEFLLMTLFLNPQRYGLRVQYRIAHTMKYTSLSSSLDCGDFLNREGEEVEIKCSFLSETNNTIAVKQIRPWQKLKYYYVFVVFFHDLRNLQYKCFKLSKKEMEEEMVLCNAKPVHSTKERNEGNLNVEYGLSVKTNSDTYTRWLEQYELKKFNLEQICEERIKEESYKKDLEDTIKALEEKTRYSFSTNIEEPIFDEEREIPVLTKDEIDLFTSIEKRFEMIPAEDFDPENPYIQLVTKEESEHYWKTNDKYSDIQVGEIVTFEAVKPLKDIFMNPEFELRTNFTIEEPKKPVYSLVTVAIFLTNSCSVLVK